LKNVQQLDYVTYAGVYDNSFVVQAELKSDPASASSSGPATAGAGFTRHVKNVDIILHANVDASSPTLKEKFAKAAHVDADSLTITGSQEQDGKPLGGKVRIAIQERYLETIAAIDEVVYIHEVHPAKLHNDVARAILNADVTLDGIKHKGKGEVVAVADTGFDLGKTDDTHPAFTGRIKSLYALGRPSPAKADDPAGHGTHVCGSVAGNGMSKDMGQAPLNGKIESPASEAQLVVQSLLDVNGNLGGIPTTLGDLFTQPYEKDEARVHTNSWGSSPDPSRNITQLPYDDSAREIDKFVYNHPDMVICFAAGNDGADRDKNGQIDGASIGAEAAAKNCITVGASESLRTNISRPDVDYTVPPGHGTDTPFTWGGYWPSTYPTAPISGDHMANNSDGIAAFSSRGPTKERRFKPDVVAPGSCILSTKSRVAQDEGYYGISRDEGWMYDSGTSMATPLVAGCCAVLRHTLREKIPKPSAALIKALLINGAVGVVGQYHPSEAGTSPNNSSGFGRVNLAGSVIIPGKEATANCAENQKGLDTGETFEAKVTIP
jgi:serine protease AprX